MRRSTIFLLLLGIAFGAGVWVVDALVDTYIFREGTFWQVLILAITPEDGFDRLVAVAGVLLFAMLVDRTIRRTRQMQNTLNNTLAINRDLLEHAGAALIKLDADGAILEANPAASILSGYSQEELIGLSARTLLPNEGWTDSPLSANSLREGQIVAREHLLRRKDGTTLSVEIRPRLLKQGQVEAFIEDITPRMQATASLQASETRYRQLMEHAPNGIFVFEGNGNIIEVNQRACELLGYGREEFAALSVPSLMLPEEAENGTSSMEKLLAGENVFSERYMIHKNGALIPVEISSRMIAENMFQSIVRDITRQREAEKNLRVIDDRFRQLFETTSNGIVIVAESGIILQVNRTVQAMFGYSSEELVGSPLHILLPEHLRSSHDRYFRTYVKHPANLNMGREREFRGRRKDGSTFPIETDLSFSNTQGEFLAFATITDISQRFQHEVALRASEERFRSIFEEAPIGISLTDAEGRMLSINPALVHMLGYEEQELIGTSFLEFTHPDDRHLEDAQRARLHEDHITAYTVDKRYVRKDEQTIWVQVSVSRFPGEYTEGPITIALIEDITERREAELALQKANRAYRMISECSQALVRAVDEHEMLNEICEIIVNIGGYRLAWVGVPAEDQSGNVLPVAWAGDDLQTINAAGSTKTASDQSSPSQTAIRTGGPVIAHGVSPKGSSRKGRQTSSSVALPLRLGEQRFGMVEIESADLDAFDDKEVVLLAELASDIAFGMAAQRLQTYRRQAERHLMESEALFRAFFDNTSVGTAILSPDGRFVEMNEAISEMFGYSTRELIGKHFSVLKSEDKFARLDLAFEHLIRGGWKADTFEDQCVRKDGQGMWARISVSTIDTPRGDVQYITGIIQDVTEAKRAEQQLATLAAELDQRVKERTSELQAAYEKLQALGEVKDAFVSNVSHELRTPITSLKLYQALLEKRPSDSSLYLARIRRETRRLEVIIEDLLTLSRLEQGRMEVIPAPTDVNQILSNLTDDRSIIAETRHIELSCDFNENVPTLDIDSSLIGQAVSVLLTNAINYTQEGGHIKVITSYDPTADPKELAITVQDDGPGIPRDELPKLFGRFYRGQAGSKLGIPGTGLGLAIASEIISRHGGRIEVFSEGIPGKGAAFTIWLPVV